MPYIWMVWEYLQTLMPRMGLILSTPLYKQMAIRVEVFNILVYIYDSLLFPKHLFYIFFSLQIFSGVTWCYYITSPNNALNLEGQILQKYNTYSLFDPSKMDNSLTPTDPDFSGGV